MKLKSIGIVVGVTLALVGLMVGAGGVGVLATIGTDGKVSTGQQSFDTSGAALVTSAADLRNPEKVADIVNTPLGLPPRAGLIADQGPGRFVAWRWRAFISRTAGQRARRAASRSR